MADAPVDGGVCAALSEGGGEAFWVIIGIFGIAAAVGYVYLCLAGQVGKYGEGLFATWNSDNCAVRTASRITLGGLGVASGLALLSKLAVMVYERVAPEVGCVAAPEMWIPSFVFTIALILVFTAYLLPLSIPDIGSVLWAIFSLTVGFWLATWGASTFAMVWVPAAIAALPLVFHGKKKPVRPENASG